MWNLHTVTISHQNSDLNTQINTKSIFTTKKLIFFEIRKSGEIHEKCEPEMSDQ